MSAVNISHQCQPGRTTHKSRTNSDPPAGPQSFSLSPCPGSPSLRISHTLLQHIPHNLRVLCWTGVCMRSIRLPAPGRISWPHFQLSLPARRFCCVTMSDAVIGGFFIEQRWAYTVRIIIIYPELLKLVSSHPAGDVVYLAVICKHTSRATEADLSTWKVSAHHTDVFM